MLYRTFHGKIVSINKNDFHSDSSYYAKIIASVFNKKVAQKNNTIEHITNLLESS